MAKLSVLDIARRLGKSPQIVREEIKADVYPFAVAIRSADNVGWDYTIFPRSSKNTVQPLASLTF